MRKIIMNGHNGDQYTAAPEKADFNNTESAKDKINRISDFPNPYFGGNDLERSMGERIIRFTGLPKEVTIRIYTLAGVFVRRIDKSDLSEYIDWDLKNENEVLWLRESILLISRCRGSGLKY